MDERAGFLKLLAENEDDTTTRLVYADWLDDRGEHEEADRQRKWVAAREWLVRLCDANNRPADRDDPHGSFVPYETLLGLAQVALQSGFDEDLWFTCRNNRALCSALRDNEEEFWKNAALVTGAEYRLPESESGDPCGSCPGG